MSRLHVTDDGRKIWAKVRGDQVDLYDTSRGEIISTQKMDSKGEARELAEDRESVAKILASVPKKGR